MTRHDRNGLFFKTGLSFERNLFLPHKVSDTASNYRNCWIAAQGCLILTTWALADPQ